MRWQSCLHGSHKPLSLVVDGYVQWLFAILSGPTEECLV